MKLKNIEIIQATNALQDLELSFPIRSAVRVNRAQKKLEDAAQDIQDRREEINDRYRATNDAGEELFTARLDGEQEEMTLEAIQNHDELGQNSPIQPKFEDQEGRQEELEAMMQEESSVDTEDLGQILPGELDAIQDAFQADRVSKVLESIQESADLAYEERQAIEAALEEELADGVQVYDTKPFFFLFPSEENN
jgi:hypothetical protein